MQTHSWYIILLCSYATRWICKRKREPSAMAYAISHFIGASAFKLLWSQMGSLGTSPDKWHLFRSCHWFGQWFNKLLVRFNGHGNVCKSCSSRSRTKGDLDNAQNLLWFHSNAWWTLVSIIIYEDHYHQQNTRLLAPENSEVLLGAELIENASLNLTSFWWGYLTSLVMMLPRLTRQYMIYYMFFSTQKSHIFLCWRQFTCPKTSFVILGQPPRQRCTYKAYDRGMGNAIGQSKNITIWFHQNKEISCFYLATKYRVVHIKPAWTTFPVQALATS